MKRFDDAFRVQLRELLIWRRDVRRFRTEALPPGTIERLIDLACLAPSVGLSQPWRFVIVDDPHAAAPCLMTSGLWSNPPEGDS
jgi:5,6-dimethylbenzimidazole synthase